MKIGVIIFGPQGSGKGTQAELLADKFDLFRFDTGGYLREILYDPKTQKNKIIQKERKLNEAGKLNTEFWVTKIVSQKFKQLIKLGQGIVVEGSPRTLFEAFGDKKRKGIIDILERGYGKKNIFIFVLNIPQKESIKRIMQRSICSVCKTPLLDSKFQGKNFKFKMCPFCGGRVTHRVDDNKKAIITRLGIYKKLTQPIFNELKRRKYKIHRIDGTSMPHKVHKKIVSYLPRQAGD